MFFYPTVFYNVDIQGNVLNDRNILLQMLENLNCNPNPWKTQFQFCWNVQSSEFHNPTWLALHMLQMEVFQIPPLPLHLRWVCQSLIQNPAPPKKTKDKKKTKKKTVVNPAVIYQKLNMYFLHVPVSEVTYVFITSFLVSYLDNRFFWDERGRC